MPSLQHHQRWVSHICSQELPLLFVLPDCHLLSSSGKLFPNFELFHNDSSKSPVLPGNFHFHFFLNIIFFLLLSTRLSARFLNLQRSRKQNFMNLTWLLMLVFSFPLPEWTDVLHRQGFVLLLSWWHSSDSLFTSTGCPSISGQGTPCTFYCQGRKI